MASTGPSNTYHLLSKLSAAFPPLTSEERIPSVLVEGEGKGGMECKEGRGKQRRGGCRKCRKEQERVRSDAGSAERSKRG